MRIEPARMNSPILIGDDPGYVSRHVCKERSLVPGRSEVAVLDALLATIPPAPPVQGSDCAGIGNTLMLTNAECSRDRTPECPKPERNIGRELQRARRNPKYKLKY